MAVLLSTAMSTTTACKISLKKLSDESVRVLHWKPESGTLLFGGMSALTDAKKKYKVSLLGLAVKNQPILQTNVRISGKITTKRRENNPIFSEGRDGDADYGTICPGCGIFMQDKDPNLPGYYKERISKEKDSEQEEEEGEYIDGELDAYELDEEDDDGVVDEFEDDVEDILKPTEGRDDDSASGDEFDWESDGWEAKFDEDDEDLESEGFAPAGVGYGNITEEVIEKGRKKRLSKAERKKIAREAAKEIDDTTVCARCHSLRNHGQVKNQAVENLIPDFDFDKLISTRLIKPMGNAGTTVVVMVVDCVDFDGSFPKRAAKSLFTLLEKAENDPKLSKTVPKLVLVATKVDLLPSQISPTRLDRWVRHRAKAGGAPKLSGVYLVSSRKDLGVKNLLAYIKELAGPRGNVWVIGAQNAGKSTLINTLSKKGNTKVTRLTEAAVPGTTLGILRIAGILSAKAKMYDTPGLLHPYLMSIRLNREEQKMVEIRKELLPRTFRVKVGQSIHVGGLVRLDLFKASVETIYISVWASHSVSLHLGKTENADEILKSHVGVRLQPPIGGNLETQLGEWEEEIQVEGSSWDVNSIDIAVAGLGWFSLGLKGKATLALRLCQGVDVTLREPLVLDRAKFLERPGFWLPKAVSEAIGVQTKLEAQKRKKQLATEDFLSEISA